MTVSKCYNIQTGPNPSRFRSFWNTAFIFEKQYRCGCHTHLPL